MTNKSVNTVARVQDMTPRIEVTSQVIADILAFANGEEKEAASLAQALDTFKGTQLARLIAKLEGVSPVSNDQWASDWMEPAKAAYLASGRSKQTDPVKLGLSMGSAVSLTKVAVIGITNRVPAHPDETLSTYSRRMQGVLKTKGLIPGQAKAETTKAAERKAPGADHKTKAPNTLDQAALILGNKDAEFASKLTNVATLYRAEFVAWYDKLMAFEAAKAAL